MVLDHNGGPNHVGNYCGAPIMINTETGQIYYTPVYHILSQFSKTTRPGDKAVKTSMVTLGQPEEELYACATINKDNLLSVQVLNTSGEEQLYHIEINGIQAKITIAANALQTVQVQL